MVCPECGKQNPEGAKFCAFCGTAIDVPAPKSAPVAHAPYMRPKADAGEQPESRRVKRGVVTNGGVSDSIPRRAAPIRPARGSRTRPDTRVPRKQTRDDDLFFEDMDIPEENPADDYEERGLMMRRVRSGVAGVLLLAILSFVFWIMVLPGGQAFRASLGMGTSAEAYAQLGAQYLRENSLRRAAEAYYDALRLDPDNYEYALLVAQTQSLIGERTKALSAYAKCISLKPEDPEPYAKVADIYRQMGDTDRMIDALAQGFERTGDMTLLKTMQEAMRDKN